MRAKPTNERSLRIVSLVALALVTAVFLSVAPRDADGNWARSLVVGKAVADAEHDRKGLSRYFDGLMNMAEKAKSIAIEALPGGDESGEARIDEVLQGHEKLVGRLAFDMGDPSFGLGEALLNRGKSVVQKIKGVFGSAHETASEAETKARALWNSATQRDRYNSKTPADISKSNKRATSSRRLMALAISGSERSHYETRTHILDDKPLPTPVGTKSSSKVSESKDRDDTDADLTPWYEKDFVRRHEDYRHCWGVFDDDDDRDSTECMAATDAKRRASARATAKAEPEQPSAGKSSWASDEWESDGNSWSGLDTSRSRYDESDMVVARVGVYALECWGYRGVTVESSIYFLMKSKMEQNECPKEKRKQEQANEAKEDYESALNAAFDEERSESPAQRDNDYRNALNAVEASEEQQRQARLAEQRRETAERETEHRHVDAKTTTTRTNRKISKNSPECSHLNKTLVRLKDVTRDYYLAYARDMNTGGDSRLGVQKRGVSLHEDVKNATNVAGGNYEAAISSYLDIMTSPPGNENAKNWNESARYHVSAIPGAIDAFLASAGVCRRH